MPLTDQILINYCCIHPNIIATTLINSSWVCDHCLIPPRVIYTVYDDGRNNGVYLTKDRNGSISVTTKISHVTSPTPEQEWIITKISSGFNMVLDSIHTRYTLVRK